MIRRKKLLKLGKIKKLEKSKEQKAFEAMVNTAASNYKARLGSRKHQELLRQKLQERDDKPSSIPYDPQPTWLDGKTKKVTIFDNINLNNIDTETINQKRKELNMPTIEEGAIQAIEQAKEKAKRVGILYNKGGYQLLTNEKDAKDLGKKTSEIN